MIWISHKGRTVCSVLHDQHCHKCIQVFLASAWNSLILHNWMTHAWCKFTVLWNFRRTKLMTGCGKCIAVINIHHFLCCKIVFDIVDKPVCIYLSICRACNQLLGNRLSLIIGNLIHIFENRSKRKLDHLESIALTKNLGITDKTLDSKCRLWSSSQHKCSCIANCFSYPENMCDLIYILKIHCHICFHANWAAICCKINALISILPDNDRFSVAFQLRNSPSHAKEAVNFIYIFTDLVEHFFFYNKGFIISYIQCLFKFDLANHVLQGLYRAFEGFISNLCLCLYSHVFFSSGTARSLPEMSMCQTTDQWSYNKFYIHSFLFHSLKYLFSPFNFCVSPAY